MKKIMPALWHCLIFLRSWIKNMAKMSFKLSASELCAAECLVNGQKLLVVTVYISPNTLVTIENL
jgi:hypothetical protein